MATFDDLRALYVNCTLKRSPERSNTQALLDRSATLLEERGVHVEHIRFVDHAVASGMSADLRAEGWADDAWPDVLWPRVLAADILVIGSPIWLGEPTSESRKLVERLYAMSDETNERGQPVYYGKVAGVVVTGNEDGVKNSAKQLLYALQHLGFTIPPAAETGWIGEIGPGPSYLDDGSGGPENEYTTTTLQTMSGNLLQVARLLTDAAGIPPLGDVTGS